MFGRVKGSWLSFWCLMRVRLSTRTGKQPSLLASLRFSVSQKEMEEVSSRRCMSFPVSKGERVSG